MMQNTTVRIKDIAEKAQVSKGTVDRVLHNRGKVSEQARERVLQVLREINYEPNLLARTLKSNKTYTLAALMPDPACDAYWQAPQTGLEKAAKELRSYGIRVAPFIFNPYQVGSFLQQATAATAARPDGILVAPVFSREAQPFFRQWQQAGIPFVLFNTQIPDAAALSYIGQDSYQSGLLVARLLHFGLPDPGPVLVAHIQEDIPNSAHLLEKEAGFRLYFEQQQLSHQYPVVRAALGNPASASFSTQLDELRRQHPNLKAVFVTNSKAFALAAYLEKQQVRHLKLIGYDLLPQNLHYLENGMISFLINQHPQGQGYWGIRQLADHLVFQKAIPPIKYLPLDIITRENLRYYMEEGQ